MSSVTSDDVVHTSEKSPGDKYRDMDTEVSVSERKVESLQTQDLFAVGNESKNGFSVDDEGLVYAEKEIKSVNCETLSEDSRTESEKDLTAE